MATDYADELRKLAATLDEAKQEINLARQQSTKPEHLRVRTRRAAVQAARTVVAAVDLGFSDLWPPGPWSLSALRNPDDVTRPPATFTFGGKTLQMLSIKLGNGCNPDGTLRDDTAFELWAQFICPVMRSKQTTSKADAGSFDFPRAKTDEQGRILGRDGKPLQRIEQTDPDTGELVGWELQGPAARVTDHYDEADSLEHLRCQAADWADACDVAADLIRNETRTWLAGNATTNTIMEAGNSMVRTSGKAGIMQESDRSALAQIFALAQKIAEQVAPLASAKEVDGATAGGYGMKVAPLLRDLLSKLEQVPSIQDVPADVLTALQALAQIVRGTRTECVAYGDVALHLSRNDMFPVAAEGWKALVRFKPENKGLLSWASQSTPDRSKEGVIASEPAAKTDRNSKAVSRPPEAALQVWRLRDLSGINNQTELAKKLTEQGVSATQGQVSRWLKVADNYLSAGNILPSMEPLAAKPQSIDPDIIEMGERLDGLTPRQRKRRDPDSDDG